MCNVDFDFVQEQPRLVNTPLKTVLCQARFPAQIGFGETQLRPVQRRLADNYPRAEIAQLNELRLDAVGVTPMNMEQVFHFRDAAGAWTVTITRSFVSLETTAYENFPDFIRRWHFLMSVVADELDLDRQERIGLRYVNQVPLVGEPTAAALSSLLKPEIVGMVGAHPSTERLLSSMQELRFARDRGACTVRHGLIPRDDAASDYVVDLDLYDDQPGELDVDAQARLLAEFNHQAFDLFRWFWQPEQWEAFSPEESS